LVYFNIVPTRSLRGAAKAMRISVTEAKAQLTDLVRRAEAGDEIVLTRHGQDVARISPIKARPLDADARRRILDAARAAGAAKSAIGPSAARSQDFLYGEDGLPK
jgi:prevent-host-death family protein